MHFSFIAALVFTAVCILPPVSADAAQLFQITSLSGGVDGTINTTYYRNGQYTGYSQDSYSLPLDPANNVYSVESGSPYSSSYGTLTTSFADSAISFSAITQGYSGNPAPDARVDATGHYQLSIHFTVTDATQMQISLAPYRQGASGNASYALATEDFYNSSPNVLTLLQLAGVDQITLYTLRPSSFGRTLDNADGTNDGVFYFATLQPGFEYVFTLDASADYGKALATGSLNFTPVPEPSGVLLLLLGLTLLNPRRRTRRD